MAVDKTLKKPANGRMENSAYVGDPRDLIALFEQSLEALADTFHANISDYFFTEKELHAHFYHLCIVSRAFAHRGFSLLHTEYPSPFKCSYMDDKPYIVHEPVDSKKQRSHIDCVLVNPLFVDWLLRRSHGIRELIGIGNKRFDLYIKDFYKTYAEFNCETGEEVLLYAVEFKFLRHVYAGSKYPTKGVHQDIAKLRLLSTFGDHMTPRVAFVKRTRAMVFVGERTQRAGKALQVELETYDPEEYGIVAWKP